MKNSCLNFFKGIGCILVIFLHFHLPGIGRDIAGGLARFAVPLFFMISGYYIYNSDRETVKRKLPGKIKHILYMCIYATLLYAAFTIAQLYIDGGVLAITEWIKEYFNAGQIFRMLFLGDMWFLNCSMLWFLYALLWSYVALYFVNRFQLYKAAYIIIPFCFLARMILFGVTNYYFTGIHWLTVNNFVVTGFPYVMIGNLLARYKDTILPKIRIQWLSVSILIGILLGVISDHTKMMVDIAYIGVILYAVCVFLLAQKYPQQKICGFLEMVGEKCFSFVYIMHMMVGYVLNKVFLLLDIYRFPASDWAYPIAIVIVTVGSAIIWMKLLELFKRFPARTKK